jgi:hypothetical protein
MAGYSFREQADMMRAALFCVITRCIITQKSAVLSYFAAKA